MKGLRLTPRGESLLTLAFGIGVVLAIFGGVWLVSALAYWWTGVK